MRANDRAGLLCATTTMAFSCPCHPPSMHAIGAITAIIGMVAVGTVFVRTTMSGKSRNSPLAQALQVTRPIRWAISVATIRQMIRACDGQVAELKNMPLDAVAGIINSTPDQTNALDHIRSVALEDFQIALAHSASNTRLAIRACHSRPVAFVGSAPGTSRCTPSQGFPHKIPKAVRTRSREIVHSLTLSCLVFQRPPRADAQGILCSRCRD